MCIRDREYVGGSLAVCEEPSRRPSADKQPRNRHLLACTVHWAIHLRVTSGRETLPEFNALIRPKCSWLIHEGPRTRPEATNGWLYPCLLYTSDAADERSSVDLGGRRII